ncbi:hypothetical protein ACIO3S_03740 [Nocardioides sp. NPDC087217]|uniref:hypothetical protein n=1 Tax=Nocardioides sp. NPDC087217 TaxID=3364335 RepID=UPI0038025690
MSDLFVAIVSAVVGAAVGSGLTTLAATIRWRRVQVRAHRARWLEPEESLVDPPASGFLPVDFPVDGATAGANLHVKIVNRSTRDVEVTHVWLATDPVRELDLSRFALPVRIRPDETHEVWFPIGKLPADAPLERLATVRLSTGKTIRSRPNDTVPPFGSVARAQG